MYLNHFLFVNDLQALRIQKDRLWHYELVWKKFFKILDLSYKYCMQLVHFQFKAERTCSILEVGGYIIPQYKSKKAVNYLNYCNSQTQITLPFTECCKLLYLTARPYEFQNFLEGYSNVVQHVYCHSIYFIKMYPLLKTMWSCSLL